jgi:hypothetical protein
MNFKAISADEYRAAGSPPLGMGYTGETFTDANGCEHELCAIVGGALEGLAYVWAEVDQEAGVLASCNDPRK